MNTTNEIKLELIYKQSFYRNKRCTEPEQSFYYLNKEDFENLIEDNICDREIDINKRRLRIELIVVSNQSNEYKMAVRNSEKQKKAKECRKEIEEYWKQPKIRLEDLTEFYSSMIFWKMAEPYVYIRDKIKDKK